MVILVNWAEIQVKSVHFASFTNHPKWTLFTRFMTQLTIYALVSCLSAHSHWLQVIILYYQAYFNLHFY